MYVCVRLSGNAFHREGDHGRTQRQTSPRHDQISIGQSAFRMLTLKLGQANIPMIVTNHTYDVIGSYVPTKEMGGAVISSMQASTIIYLKQEKEKDGTEVVGNLIKQRLLSRV